METTTQAARRATAVALFCPCDPAALRPYTPPKAIRKGITWNTEALAALPQKANGHPRECACASQCYLSA
jgi:hypothetical protein